MATPEEFARRMKVRAKNIPLGATKLKRRVALAIDQFLVIRCPVDTGRARSNFLVNLSAPRTDEIDPYVPGSPGASAQAALDQGQKEIARATQKTDIHITNNVVYVPELNAGSSPQAKAGFIEGSVRDGVRVGVGDSGAIVEITRG